MSWRRGLEKLLPSERESFEHLAARLEFDAADYYPTRDDAERAAYEMVSDARIARALHAAVYAPRAESPSPPSRGEDD